MSAVQTFRVEIPDEALADLTARLKATRWIDDVFEGDWRFGAPVPFVRALCDHWLKRFDWRAFEARINGEPNICAEIDGLTIHAINRRSSRPEAIPLMLIHGWPSAFLEFQHVWAPLAEPPAGEPAFHVVVPSLPGYGFSTTRPGMTPQRIAGQFATLMTRLGYPRFMVQGGNWGSLIGTEIARQHPDRVIGLHLNSVNGSPPPDRENVQLSAEEKSWVTEHGTAPHFPLFSRTPASAAHALNDSPAGLAGFIGERLRDWADNRGHDGPALSMDCMIGLIALYWFTGTAGSSALLYHAMVHDMPQERFVSVPTAAAIFAEEIVKIPRAWAERHYNIVRWTLFDRGGHYAALEVPDLLIEDLRRFAAALA